MKEEMKGLYAAVVLSIAGYFRNYLFFPKKPAVRRQQNLKKSNLRRSGKQPKKR